MELLNEVVILITGCQPAEFVSGFEDVYISRRSILCAHAMESFLICTGYGADRLSGLMSNYLTSGLSAAMRQIFIDKI